MLVLYAQVCTTPPSIYNQGINCNKMRLVNGTHRCSGRLEVNQDGEWGTVCGDYWWDMHDASVVCREQGCGEPVDAVEHASFGQGSGPILMHEVHCWGTESRLKNCMSQDNARFFCGHDKDAGVICSGQLKKIFIHSMKQMHQI
uniref:SRCR domain-containing protein n=1 Tax=Denticeps clupeoides TaxID=299321 RepID=A0AAY4A5N0_9TELE